MNACASGPREQRNLPCACHKRSWCGITISCYFLFLQLFLRQGLLGISEKEVQEIIRRGGAQIAVENIWANLDSAKDVLRALQVINQLAIDEPSILALRDAGSLDACLEALKKFRNNADVVQSVLQVLCAMLVNEEIAEEVCIWFHTFCSVSLDTLCVDWRKRLCSTDGSRHDRSCSKRKVCKIQILFISFRSKNICF